MFEFFEIIIHYYNLEACVTMHDKWRGASWLKSNILSLGACYSD